MQEIKISEKSVLIRRIYLFLFTLVLVFLFRKLTLLWLSVYLFFNFFYIRAYYKKLSLTLENNTLTLKSGVFYKFIRQIKTENIQFIKEIKTPLCLLFKVKTIKIYTSGGKITTPHLPDSFDEKTLRGN